MRDYPSVPNVFRAASSHSINNMGVTGTPHSSSGNNSNGCNNNKQQANGHVPNNNKAAPLHSNSYEQHSQKQQPQQQQQQQQPPVQHQLTTTASIERSYQPAHSQQQQQQQQQQQSPYATLPRGPRQPPQLQHLRAHSNNNSNSTSSSQERANPPTVTRQQTGVINTISGSIPATGFGSLAGSFSDLQLNNLHNVNGSSNNNTNQGRRLREAREQQQQHAALGANVTAAHTYKSDEHQQQRGLALSNNNHNKNHTSSYNHVVGTPMTAANSGYLWILTPVAASISVAIVIAALAGPQWLFTEEKLPNVNYNGTANFNALDDGAYVTKYTKSSLWILCTTLPGVDTYNCIKIDYFPKEGYQPDPQDSTAAIPYTVTKSCPIFLTAGIFLLISFIVFLIPTCSHQNNLYYFCAGILFIVSGLVMLIGLIAYISILKAEIGSKLRPRSTLQPALFKVSYGQSFFLFVFGFIATEFVGVLNIFLFINLQEVSYYSRLPCFSIANIHEKIKEGQHPLSHSYKRYKSPTLAATAQDSRRVSQQQQQQQLPQRAALRQSNIHGNGRLHQVHDMGLSQTLPAGYACRKHPNGSNLNLYLHNDLEHRFYFEKPAVSKCNLHSRSFAKSLNELCTEPATPAPPPPPSALRMSVAKAHHTLPTQTFADLPQEFPLTRSVSTTTDIYTAATPQPLQRKQRRHMATNTQRPSDACNKSSDRRDRERPTRTRYYPDDDDNVEEQAARLCGLKRGIRKTKDELFQEFCKRAGVRSKPKNIYYIGSEQGANTTPEQPQRRRLERATPDHDDDDDGDEHGFKQFRSGAPIDEEQLYLVGDQAQLVVPRLSATNQQRRASMCVDALSANHLRKLNSNLSLHTLQAERSANRQSLYDLENCDSTSIEIWPALAQFGGSQTRLPQEYGTLPYVAPTQSRTLPRCFLRQPAPGGSQDSLGSLQSNISTSQQRFSQLMVQHQQQLQQQNRYLSTLTLHKPTNEEQTVNSSMAKTTAVQWPAAIPSSPAHYPNTYQLYAPTVSSSSNSAAVQHAPPAKFQRAYAFDDAQRRASFAVSDAFDLDEIERERRRSHASLFGGRTQEQYDLINGTAV